MNCVDFLNQFKLNLLQRFDLRDSMSDAVSALTSLIQLKNLNFTCVIDAMMPDITFTDGRRFIQVSAMLLFIILLSDIDQLTTSFQACLTHTHMHAL
jgi:hypothetical protein